jgi:hypothetical protein
MQEEIFLPSPAWASGAKSSKQSVTVARRTSTRLSFGLLSMCGTVSKQPYALNEAVSASQLAQRQKSSKTIKTP